MWWLVFWTGLAEGLAPYEEPYKTELACQTAAEKRVRFLDHNAVDPRTYEIWCELRDPKTS